MYFPIALSYFAEMQTSIKRIKEFLMHDENCNETIKSPNDIVMDRSSANGLVKQQGEKPGVHLKSVSVKWLESLPDNCLEDISLEVRTPDHLAIVGTVGSGKSTLLQVILGELPTIEGTVTVSDSMSYASQEPWIFGASVRQNILFGQEYNKEKYKEVVKVCALERDLSLFSYGDRTLVGERGVTLSGGQKARINLARAVYKEADIYLLDDPLSAVDTNVGKQIFDECISGYLKNKCVILVTHQLQYLKQMNKIILLQDGQIKVKGSYNDLKNTNTNFSEFFTDNEEEDNKETKVQEKSDLEQENSNVQVTAKEEKGSGDISWHVYKSYIVAGGHWSTIAFLLIILVGSQLLNVLAEYFVTFW